MKKNNANGTVFYSDRCVRKIPVNIVSVMKIGVLSIVLWIVTCAGITLCNLYRLSNARKSYLAATENMSSATGELQRQLEAMEKFAEKASFFLGEPFASTKPSIIVQAGEYSVVGMGGGEEIGIEGISKDGSLSIPEIVSPPVAHHEIGDIQTWVSDLKNRLDQLAALALEKKQYLDHTPSIWPAPGLTTSKFGWRRSPFTGKRHFHRGIDLVNKTGTPILAPAAGRVIFVGRNEILWGNSISIEHRDGIVTSYGHLSAFEVSSGDSVHRGDIIGYMGNSGRSTGTHLHYQIEIGGKAVDPIQFILEENY